MSWRQAHWGPRCSLVSGYCHQQLGKGRDAVRAQQVGHNARSTHTFSLTAGLTSSWLRWCSTQQPSPQPQLSTSALSQPPVPPLEPAVQTCPPAALTDTLAIPGTLLTPSLWDYGCPLCPVTPTALELHLQQPTRTRILSGTLAHPVPPIHDLTLAAPGMVVCSLPNSASLAQSP